MTHSARPLGASAAALQEEEKKLGVILPEQLKAVLRVSNGLDLPGDWRLYPVFDPADPRGTCNSIHYENTKGRWSYMSAELLSIADNGTGNQLVLKVRDGRAEAPILVWNHETSRTSPWKGDFARLLSHANARILKIQKRIERNAKRGA